MASCLRVSPPPNTLGRGHPRPSRVWGLAAGAHGGFSTGGLGALTCPPAAAPRGQAAVAVTGEQIRARKAHTRRTPAPLAQRDRKAHAQLRASRPLFRYLLDAPANGNCGRPRVSLSLQTTESENVLKTHHNNKAATDFANFRFFARYFWNE